MNSQGRLLVSCPDRPGIIAAVSAFLFERGANIVHSDQHSTDPSGGRFFLRVEFELSDLRQRSPQLELEFEPIAERYQMEWRITHADDAKRLAIFASREDHGLLELLWQRRAGDLRAEIAMVISNHPETGRVVAPWGVPFHHIPVTPDTRIDAERRQRELTSDTVDLIVLARYMQVLSPEFVGEWHHRIINIHHSFLPAFIGANPYAQARARGVKLIGATAHYVTDALDAGPIIEQDVHRVDHRHSTADLRRIGRQIERAVLARAVIWHVEDRILVDGNKTVVFS
ncbi:MAG TPA: formyltetrahydrofolate deformylase [Thermomicrobiales bacterium]|nr:formyltetrahydrofolate deformylase [Thermomicrobiales bacterium]